MAATKDTYRTLAGRSVGEFRDRGSKFIAYAYPSFSEEDWKAGAGAFAREQLRRGDYYLREQQYCNKISFIESGLFRLFYLHEGAEKIMMFFSEQQFVTDYFG